MHPQRLTQESGVFRSSPLTVHDDPDPLKLLLVIRHPDRQLHSWLVESVGLGWRHNSGGAAGREVAERIRIPSRLCIARCRVPVAVIQQMISVRAFSGRPYRSEFNNPEPEIIRRAAEQENRNSKDSSRQTES